MSSTLQIPDGLKTSSVDKNGSSAAIEAPDETPVDPEQKFYICNMVSPESAQKGDVHAFRMLAVCKNAQEAKTTGMMYGQRDPRFAIYQGKFGKFTPWVFDHTTVKDADTQHKEMRNLLDQQEQQQKEAEDHFYDRVMAEKMAAHKAQLAKQIALEEGREPEEEGASKGNAVSAKYNILQLTHMCRKRLEELKFWEERYATDFSDEDRKFAEEYNYPPEADVAPMFVM